MKFNKYIFIAILSVFVAWSSCKKDKADSTEEEQQEENNNNNNQDTCDSTLSYSVDIAPIFSTSCAKSGCHDSGTARSGVVLETHSQISSQVTTGKAFCALNHESGCISMPPGGKIGSTQIDNIQCWINAGTPNN